MRTEQCGLQSVLGVLRNDVQTTRTQEEIQIFATGQRAT